MPAMHRIVLFLAAVLAAPLALAQAPATPQPAQPNPAAPLYRAVGEQYRVYEFPGTGEPIPYRLYVPESWTPEQRLPVLVTLRAGTSINNNHRDGNDLVQQAREHGYIVVSPLGYRGLPQPYYGSPWPVDRPGGPSVPAAGWTADEDQRAEQDVLNVLDIVLAEYNADPARVFLHGQNPSGSAAMHFAATHTQRLRGIVVSSGPIVSEGYPFGRLRDANIAVLVLHGELDTSNSVAASERMAMELQQNGIETEYRVVPGGEHLNSYLKDAAAIFDFLDRHAAP